MYTPCKAHTRARSKHMLLFLFFFFFLHTQRRSIRSGHRPRLDAHPRQLASPAARGLPALAVVMLRRKEEREGLTAADTFPFCSLPNARGRRMTPRANSSRAEGEPDDFASCPHGQVARRWWEYFFFFFYQSSASCRRCGMPREESLPGKHGHTFWATHARVLDSRQGSALNPMLVN